MAPVFMNYFIATAYHTLAPLYTLLLLVLIAVLLLASSEHNSNNDDDLFADLVNDFDNSDNK